MEPYQIFQYTVLTFLLTTIIYVFMENKNNIEIPTFEQQLQKESKHRLFISLGISIILVILLIIFKNKN